MLHVAGGILIAIAVLWILSGGLSTIELSNQSRIPVKKLMPQRDMVSTVAQFFFPH